MGADTPYLPVVAGVALATYAMRLLPGLLLAGRPMPPIVVQWMGFVPVAVLAAILAPSVLVGDDTQLLPVSRNVALWAAVPSCLVAFITRNFLVTVVASVALMAIMRLWAGAGVA